MTYNKETVVGVLEQCKKIYQADPYSWDHLISMAKEGKFTNPTLEAVWKEKIDKLGYKDRQTFMFDFEGVTYISIIDPLDCITYWYPKEIVKI